LAGWQTPVAAENEIFADHTSAQLAAYLEPREHGATSPVSHIREAIEALHASAEALAALFAVDLARAHQARLEALLGAPLPVSLVEGRGEER